MGALARCSDSDGRPGQGRAANSVAWLEEAHEHEVEPFVRVPGEDVGLPVLDGISHSNRRNGWYASEERRVRRVVTEDIGNDGYSPGRSA